MKNQVSDCHGGKVVMGIAEYMSGKKDNVWVCLSCGQPCTPVSPTHKCIDCGAEMNEGEAKTFTVCDKCWERAYAKKGVSPMSEAEKWANENLDCAAYQNEGEENLRIKDGVFEITPQSFHLRACPNGWAFLI